MNHPIRFRIWNNKTSQWIHGPNGEVNLFGEMILLGGFLKGISVKDLNDCIPLQYTGIKDCKDKEIYEGDIVKVYNDNNRFIVRFGKVERKVVSYDCYVDYPVEINGFYFESLEDKKAYFSITTNCFGENDLAGTEIIGNIFENPDIS